MMSVLMLMRKGIPPFDFAAIRTTTNRCGSLLFFTTPTWIDCSLFRLRQLCELHEAPRIRRRFHRVGGQTIQRPHDSASTTIPRHFQRCMRSRRDRRKRKMREKCGLDKEASLSSPHFLNGKKPAMTGSYPSCLGSVPLNSHVLLERNQV